MLGELEPQCLEHGWFAQFPYRPPVAFCAAHSDDHLYLRYYVQEQTIQARYYTPNEPVYRDSCVELFIAFDESSYYNLEFNCLGTCLMEFGTGRNGRTKVKKGIIDKIQRQALIGRTLPGRTLPGHESNLVDWQLTLGIPLEVFYKHEVTSLSGMRVRGNFQKCGDDTPQPHYLSWNQIETPTPDFHQPAFFGELVFLPEPEQDEE